MRTSGEIAGSTSKGDFRAEGVVRREGMRKIGDMMRRIVEASCTDGLVTAVFESGVGRQEEAITEVVMQLAGIIGFGVGIRRICDETNDGNGML